MLKNLFTRFQLICFVIFIVYDWWKRRVKFLQKNNDRNKKSFRKFPVDLNLWSNVMVTVAVDVGFFFVSLLLFKRKFRCIVYEIVIPQIKQLFKRQMDKYSQFIRLQQTSNICIIFLWIYKSWTIWSVDYFVYFPFFFFFHYFGCYWTKLFVI